jgi:hypothetical protein
MISFVPTNENFPNDKKLNVFDGDVALGHVIPAPSVANHLTIWWAFRRSENRNILAGLSYDRDEAARKLIRI